MNITTIHTIAINLLNVIITIILLILCYYHYIILHTHTYALLYFYALQLIIVNYAVQHRVVFSI